MLKQCAQEAVKLNKRLPSAVNSKGKPSNYNFFKSNDTDGYDVQNLTKVLSPEPALFFLSDTLHLYVC